MGKKIVISIIIGLFLYSGACLAANELDGIEKIVCERIEEIANSKQAKTIELNNSYVYCYDYQKNIILNYTEYYGDGKKEENTIWYYWGAEDENWQYIDCSQYNDQIQKQYIDLAISKGISEAETLRNKGEIISYKKYDIFQNGYVWVDNEEINECIKIIGEAQEKINETDIGEADVISDDFEKEIYNLVERYYNAYCEKDKEALKEIRHDWNEDYEKEYYFLHMKDYDNMSIYIRPGLTDISFIVFVAFECEWIDGDLITPTVMHHYITADLNDELKICSYENNGAIDLLIRNIIENDIEISNLIQEYNKKNEMLLDENASDILERGEDTESKIVLGEKMVSLENLNVREKPNSESSIVSYIEEGQEIIKIETVEDGWCYISVNDSLNGNIKGYVKEEYLVSITGDENENAAGLSERLDSFQIKIDGNIYTFPMTYAEFAALGWKEGEYYEIDPLDPKVTTLSPFTKGDLELFVNVYKSGITNIPITEAMIGGLEVDSEDSLKTVVELPGGIVLGKSTMDDIVSTYGEPKSKSDVISYKDGEKKGIRLIYLEGRSKNRKKYWNFSIDYKTGVLTEVTVINALKSYS